MDHDSTGLQMKIKKIWSILTSIAAIAFSILLLMVFGPIFLSFVGVWLVEAKMRKPRVYEPVGRSLALYCQSDKSLLPTHMAARLCIPKIGEKRWDFDSHQPTRSNLSPAAP